MSEREPFSLPPLTLILGGQRSGKSAWAEDLIGPDQDAVYLATCRARNPDAGMALRIANHRGRRGPRWITVEEPVSLAAAILNVNAPARPVLVDSLGMWVTNLIMDGRDAAGEIEGVLNAIGELTAPVVMVSEEAGLGVIPDNDLAIEFIDALGAVNQKVAARAEQVVLVTAGIALRIKG